ncbi:MAG: GDSL-type esterase/lipase family protein [Paracoccaceae bacterium]|nr:GDSL-type esterase/lipase family protein [Paracoccaceae bacterium]MDG1738571.1 GDSL-type esterase/lipase family protein [Paracoccaceae bacterium]MDG2257001.1 GDSL-type esterase/lipase family protein [Paracoccaceae bacterium]
MKRILIYGDSNSWGYPCDGVLSRLADRWPVVMARDMIDVEVIEENLPGRTTVHDDAEHLGEANNGLRFLEVVLRSHAPLDAVILFLGTNDLKTRFAPDAKMIAENLGQLIKKVHAVGGNSEFWDDPTPPPVFVFVPPPLSERVDDPTWERRTEWVGARTASLGLVDAFTVMAQKLDVPIFNSAPYVTGGQDDPIHWTPDSHIRLGQAAAQWLGTQIF